MSLNRRTLLTGAVGAAGAGALGLPTSASATVAARPPRVVSATPNALLTRLFTDYGNSGVGWTGADSTYSARLSGGREMWIFSDTFLGPVDPDGGRPETTPFLNNSVIVQRGTRLATVTGGTPSAPTNLFTPTTAGNWYWVGSGLVTGDTWQQILIEFTRTGTGSFDFAMAGAALARARTDRLNEVVDIQPLPSRPPTLSWASWVQRLGPFTYVYGVEDLGAQKHMHVARVRGVDLRGPYQFWAGDGWSTDSADSARVLTGVGNEYSVTPWRGRYLLVTHDTNELFSARILAYVADRPTGPFTDPVLLYTTPETGGNIITYNSHAHPELGTDRRLLVTYNVNSLVSTELYDDVTIYRPRFVDVVLA